MRVIMHLGLMAFILIFGILFLIYMKPIANWLEKRVTEFFYKTPQGKCREMVIRVWEFYTETWYMIYLTGALMVVASIMATVYIWWVFAVPFIIFGAALTSISLKMKRRIKDKFKTKKGDRYVR